MENQNAVIIFGSSRSDGNTRKIVDFLVSHAQFDLIDLNDYAISYYDYQHKNSADDFIPLMEKITS
ncbi:MAG: NAD(P)H-dependent oxidoreductase, partial [Bacteroidota bacterium]